MSSDPRHRPKYLAIRDRLVRLILSGQVKEGDPIPSVRAIAATTGANPLTVAKAFSSLPSGVIRYERGVGAFLSNGGLGRLRATERHDFLTERWPGVAAEIRRLHLTLDDLGAGATAEQDARAEVRTSS